MPMTMKLPDPKTGRMITFEWPTDQPPTEQELEQYVFQPARAKAQAAGLIPPGLNLSGAPDQPIPRSRPYTAQEKADQGKSMAGFMGNLVELGLPLATMPLTGGMSALPSLISNMGINAVSGGIAGALTGEGAQKEAIDNASLGLVGELGGRVAPIAGNILGQALGGIKPSKQAAMAFAREGAEQWKQGKLRIGLGNEKRTLKAATEAGEAVKAAEQANPAQLSLPDTARDAYNTISGGASTANFPQDVRKRGEEFTKKYVTQQAMEFPKVVPDEVIPEGQVVGEVADTRIGARRRPLMGRGHRVVKDAEPVEGDTIDVEGFGGKTILPNDKVSVRRAGDLKRAAGKRANNIIQARKGGQLVPPDMQESQQLDAALEKAWRDAQYAVDTPKNIPAPTDNVLWPDFAQENVGPIQAANQRRADLHKMEEVHKALKDPTILGRVGQFTTRAALGAGLGQAFSEATGADANKSRLGGSAVGMAAFNPRSAGAIANALGVLFQAAPHAVRTYDTATSFPLPKKKKEVKRKDPK